jgi:hypothetical protein
MQLLARKSRTKMRDLIRRDTVKQSDKIATISCLGSSYTYKESRLQDSDQLEGGYL